MDLDLRVTAKEPAADGIVTLTLQDRHRRRLPDWESGAHIDVVLPGGLTRQYSLCGDRWDAHSYRIGVLREPDGRGGSAHIHDRLAVGDPVGLGGPRNNFRLTPSPRYLFIAGGIGITPILPMLRDAEILGADWELLYGGRGPSSMAFLDELGRYGDRVTVQTSGLLDLQAWLGRAGAATTVYCCGPAPLLRAVQELCTGRLRTERFTAEPLPGAARDLPFDLELRRSKTTLTVRPGQSILQAVTGAGIGVLSSCAQGLCGTCETTVLDGVPDHRDALLDDDERATGDRMFICVSRSRSPRLVVDL